MTEFHLWNLFPEELKPLFSVSGSRLADRLGIAAIADVVVSVLCGENIRNATELLTKRRIALLNIGLIAAYMENLNQDTQFVKTLIDSAHNRLLLGKPEPSEKLFLHWVMGLTQKTAVNVLRRDENAWKNYVLSLKDGVFQQSDDIRKMIGSVQNLKVLENTDEVLDWVFMIYLVTAIGSQTIAIRGSEKSLYGKFFEKLVLTGALNSLGFELVNEHEASPRMFWLSSSDEERESDATLMMNNNFIVKFDIGFINSGNPEIILDKVSRYAREIEDKGRRMHVKTIVVVDTIGKKSKIVEQATRIRASVIQMSLGYWPVQLGQILEELDDTYESPFDGMQEDTISAY